MVWETCQGTGLGMLGGLVVWETLSNPLFPCGTARMQYQGGGAKPLRASCAVPAAPLPHTRHSPARASLCTVHELPVVDELFLGHAATTDLFLLAVLPTLPCLTHSICTRRICKGALGGDCPGPGLRHCGMCNRVKPDFAEMVLEWKPACLLFD